MPPAFHNPALRGGGGRALLASRGGGRSGRGLGRSPGAKKSPSLSKAVTKNGTVESTKTPPKSKEEIPIEKKESAPAAIVTPEIKAKPIKDTQDVQKEPEEDKPQMTPPPPPVMPLNVEKISSNDCQSPVVEDMVKPQMTSPPPPVMPLNVEKISSNDCQSPVVEDMVSEPTTGMYQKVMDMASVYVQRETVEKCVAYLEKGWRLLKASPLADCAHKVKETTYILVPHCVGSTITMLSDHIALLLASVLKFLVSIALLLYIALLEFIVFAVVAVKRRLMSGLDTIFGPPLNSEFQKKTTKLLGSFAALAASLAVTLNHIYLVTMHVLKPSASAAIHAKQRLERKFSTS